MLLHYLVPLHEVTSLFMKCQITLSDYDIHIAYRYLLDTHIPLTNKIYEWVGTVGEGLVNRKFCTLVQAVHVEFWICTIVSHDDLIPREQNEDAVRCQTPSEAGNRSRTRRHPGFASVRQSFSRQSCFRLIAGHGHVAIWFVATWDTYLGANKYTAQGITSVAMLKKYRQR